MDLLKQIENIELIPNRFFDKFASMPVFFTLIVIFQGCFGGMGIVQTPAALTNATDHPIARAIFVSAIAYTATSDIETTIFSPAIFFVFLHLIRTEEEKKAMASYI